MPHPPGSQAQIMLAIVADKVELWRRILEGHELVFVMTLREAMQRLAEEDDLRMVIIGVHFDESQMFTLLGDIRRHPKYGHIPILVVLSPGQYAFSAIAVEGIDRAVAALGANGFLNLDQFPDNAEGEARIRRIVDSVIATGGDLLET
jgi:PleD family two-component response regulator